MEKQKITLVNFLKKASKLMSLNKNILEITVKTTTTNTKINRKNGGEKEREVNKPFTTIPFTEKK